MALGERRKGKEGRSGMEMNEWEGDEGRGEGRRGGKGEGSRRSDKKKGV